jgi:hypothetical protein
VIIVKHYARYRQRAPGSEIQEFPSGSKHYCLTPALVKCVALEQQEGLK